MRLTRQREAALEARMDAVADAWYGVIGGAAGESQERCRTREVADRLARHVLCLLRDGERCQAGGVDELVDRLLALGLPPEALGRLQEILIRELVEGLPEGAPETLGMAPRELISALTAGLLRREQARAVEAQARRRRAERRLHLMRAAAESSVTAAAMWTFEGQMAYVNPAFLTMWGYDDRESLREERIRALWANGSAPGTINASVRQAGGWIGKLTGLRQDGSRFPVMLAASLVEPRDGGRPFIMGHFIDMTYRDKLNAMLSQRIDRLRLLRQVDRGLLEAQSPADIGRAALRHIRELIPCERASVTVLRPGDERAGILAAVPSSDYGEWLEEGFPLTGFDGVVEAMRCGEIYVIDEVERLPVPASTVEMMQQAGEYTFVLVPVRCEGKLLGGLNLVLPRGHQLDSWHEAVAREVADSLAVAVRQAQLQAAVAGQAEQLRALTARLAETEEAERRRVARDLHDEIGQKLTALAITLNVAQARVDPGEAPDLAGRLEDSLELVKETTERVRRVIADLRPPMLDDYGLLPTLRWCAEQLQARTGIEVVVRGEEPAPRLPSAVEDSLVRIAQEALTNVAKHAGASRAAISLSVTEERVRLSISDDGRGFDETEIGERDCHHWGLLTMKERAAAIGGRCRIESRPGEGTRVIVEVER